MCLSKVKAEGNLVIFLVLLKLIKKRDPKKDNRLENL